MPQFLGANHGPARTRLQRRDRSSRALGQAAQRPGSAAAGPPVSTDRRPGPARGDGGSPGKGDFQPSRSSREPVTMSFADELKKIRGEHDHRKEVTHLTAAESTTLGLSAISDLQNA